MTTNTTESLNPEPRQRHGNLRFGLVAGCFLLSGFAGLLYETVWFRQFASIFGTSEAALGAVLAAYMGGLALGAAIAARRVVAIRRPLLVYGLLELGVAIGALAVPFGLKAAEKLRIFFLGGQAELPAAGGMIEIFADTGLAFVLILIPTACMGATLPMLARHAARGWRGDAVPVGWLYGINTLGAVLGTLCAAFMLLPWLGLLATTFVGVGINLAVFGFAVCLQRLERAAPDAQEGSSHVDTHASNTEQYGNRFREPRTFGLASLLVVASAASFVYEVLWTRLLGQVLGGSLYSFATMLAAFLTGIAIGSCLASRTMARGRATTCVLVLAQLVAAISTLIAFSIVDVIPRVGQWLGAGLMGGPLANVGLCLLVLLPSTIAIGMSLPLAIQIATHRGSTVSRVTGRLYAASTIGAIFGALLAGHFLLPRLGFTGTVALAAGANLLVAVCVIPVSRRTGQRQAETEGTTPLALRAALLASPFVAGALLCVGGPEAILRHVALWRGPATGHVIYSAAGASSNVLMMQIEKGFGLFTGGALESAIAPKGAIGGSESYQRWLGALPVLARPQTRSMLFVGFGGGVAVSGVPETVESIDAIELEPKVIDAVRTVADLRADNPLDDPRLNIIFNDARGALTLTSKRYDAIVSQPSHPWTAGASHLYTREFLSLVKTRLRDGGVLLQWMNTNFVDEELLQSLCATLLDVFPAVRVYHPLPTHVLFLASNSPLEVEERIARTGQPFDSGVPSLTWLGINELHDVAATLILEHEDVVRFCEGARLITDNFNRLATRSARLAGKTIGEQSETVFELYDALVDRDGRPSLVSRLRLDPARIVRSLILSDQRDRARVVVNALPKSRDRVVAEGILAAYSGQPREARQYFARAIKINPGDPVARFKLLELDMQEIATGGGPSTFQRSNLSRLEATIVDAAAYYQRSDWEGLRSLDGRLATVVPGSVEQPVTQTFRALWRAKDTRAELRDELGREAINLIDGVIAIQPSLLTGLTRLWASEQAGDMDTWLESAYQLNLLFESNRAVSNNTATVLSESHRVLATLDSLEPETDWARYRVELVQSHYEKILEAAKAVEGRGQ